MTATALAAHPVAELFPMLATDELAELAEDIKQRGLLHPIVLDGEGRILDGRNRHAACLLVDVEPDFVTYVGDDPDGYALAVNIARRNLSKGQTAMIAARACSLSEQTQRQAAKSVGVSNGRIGQANVVLEHAPDVADLVVSGAKPLNEAYKIATDRKKATEDATAQMVRLGDQAPDLADLVAEERMSLPDALAALRAREQKRADEQRDARALLTRILDLATPSSMPSGFIDSWAEHLGDVEIDLIDRTEHASQVLHDLAERIQNQ